MSGLVAQLEDARELAERLRDALSDAAVGTPSQIDRVRRVADLADAADDLASRIDNLRTALRGT